MQRGKQIFVFLFAAFCVSKGVCGYTDIPQSTEKIKIIAACQMNGKWTFNLYDGTSGKTVSVTKGRRNAQGYQRKSFDEKTQTAVIATPSGLFEIAMNEHQSAAETKEENAETPTQSAFKHGAISRKRILERIK